MPFVLRPFRRFSVQCAITYNAGPFLKLTLAYFSGFWILITLLLLSSGSAYAEWVSIGSSESGGGYTVYVNPDTIRRKGDLVKMWILLDYKTIQTVAGTSHLSVRSQHQYDCAEDRHRRLAYTFFSGNMGSGTVVYSNPDEGKWEPVASDSVAEGLWKIACDRKGSRSRMQPST
jgi:hypothetical protein